MSSRDTLKFYILGGVLLLSGVILGALNAHLLPKLLEGQKQVDVFATGIRYQMYHGLALMLLGTIQGQLKGSNFKIILRFHLIGILFFSGCCYLYALTNNPLFSRLVPFGGLALVIGWAIFLYKIFKFCDEFC